MDAKEELSTLSYEAKNLIAKSIMTAYLKGSEFKAITFMKPPTKEERESNTIADCMKIYEEIIKNQ